MNKDTAYIAKVVFIEKAIDDYKKDLIEKIEKMKGFSRCPELWIKIRKNLRGNIGMADVSEISFTQIALETKDTVAEEVINIIKNQ